MQPGQSLRPNTPRPRPSTAATYASCHVSDVPGKSATKSCSDPPAKASLVDASVQNCCSCPSYSTPSCPCHWVSSHSLHSGYTMLHEFNKRARFRCPWHCRFAAENLFSMNRMSCLFSQAPDRSDTLMIWVSKMNTSNIIQYKTQGFQKEYFNVFHIILGMGLIWIYHSKQMQTSNQKYLPSITFCIDGSGLWGHWYGASPLDYSERHVLWLASPKAPRATASFAEFSWRSSGHNPCESASTSPSC